MSVIAAVSVGNVFASVGTRTQRILDAVNWKFILFAFVGAGTVRTLWAKGGAGSAITTLTILAIAFGVIVGRRRFPQAAGVVASSTVSAFAVVIAAFASMGMSALPMVSWPVILTVPMLVLVTVAVFVAPHRGVHVGWSVALAQTTVLAVLPLGVLVPDSDWSSVAAFAVFVLAMTGVYFRSRHAQRSEGGRLRRVLRVGAVGLVSCIAALTVLLGAPGSASGLLGIGDYFESKTNEMICGFTRPDLTQETVGTGPESMLPSRNFGQVKGSPAAGVAATSTPSYSDQIGNFDRLGPKYSMDNYTLYEIAGLRGVRFVNWQKNSSGDEVCSIMPWLSVTSGNMVMSLNTYVLQAIITLKEYSQSGRPFEFLYDKTLPLVDTLFNGLFLPAAGLMFVIAGISLTLRALRGGEGFRGALGETGGVAAILVVGGLFFGGLAGASWTNPGTNGFFILGSAIDTIGASINSAVAEAAFSSLDLGGDSSLCKQPQPVPAAPGQDDAYAAAAPGQRYSSCILAEGLAYRPWAIAQFGAAGNTAIAPQERTTRFGDPRIGGRTNLVTAETDAKGRGLPCYNNYFGCADMRTYLIAQEGGPAFDTARVKCMDGADDYAHLVQCDPYHAVAGQLNLMEDSSKGAQADTASAILRAYHGEGRMPHLTQSIVALIATAIVASGVGFISVLSMWWQLMLLILFLTGVGRLLYAAFPGKASAGGEYLADFISTFMQRIGIGLVSMMMVVLVALIFGASMAMGMKILLTALLMFGMMRVSKKVQEAMKVKGTTVGDPAGNASKIVGGATALAAYKGLGAATGLAGKSAGGTAKGAYRGGKWAVTKPKPAPGSPVGAGAPAGPGSATSRPVRSPLGRVAAGAAKDVGDIAGAASRAGKTVGRGARVAAAPMRAPKAWAANSADGIGQGTRKVGRTTVRAADRGLGKAVKPITKVSAPISDTASKLGRRVVTGTREGAESAVSYLTPRSYAEYLSPEFKARADSRRDDKGWTKPRSFAEYEQRRDNRDRMYNVAKIRRRTQD